MIFDYIEVSKEELGSREIFQFYVNVNFFEL